MRLTYGAVATDRGGTWVAVTRARVRMIALGLCLAIGVASCASDGDDGSVPASGDTSYIRSQDDAAPPSLSGGDSAHTSGVVTPEPEARSLMQEKFDKMGGMQGVTITFSA